MANTRRQSQHIFIAAVEPSADANAAALYRAMKELRDDLRYSAIGGNELYQAGLESLFSIDEFSVMGFTDVLKVVPSAFKRAQQVAEHCRDQQVDVAVFVDGWTFSRICAKRIRKLSPQTKIVKYSAPQIWASRPERIDFVCAHFDLVLALLPFEPDLFNAHGVPTLFVGNPNYEAVLASRPDESFCARYGFTGKRVISILPGSRRSEVKRLMPIFGEVVATLATKHEEMAFAIAPAPTVADEVEALLADWPVQPVQIKPADKMALFHDSAAALLASGTVATELLLCDVPMVVAYQVDALTYFWAKRVMTTEFITILNIAEGREIIPEFLQEEARADMISPVLEDLAQENSKAAASQRAAFAGFRHALGLEGEKPAIRAAKAVLPLLDD